MEIWNILDLIVITFFPSKLTEWKLLGKHGYYVNNKTHFPYIKFSEFMSMFQYFSENPHNANLWKP